MMKKIILYILPLFYGCAVAQNADQLKYAELITEISNRQHMEVLATEEFEGRGTGQAGGQKAAEYIANEFEKYGLTDPTSGSYFQKVPLVKKTFVVDNFEINDRTYTNGKDFFVQGNTPTRNFSANEVIFVGYGIQDEKYDDLKGTDIKGKIVFLINEGEPTDAEGVSLITGSKELSEWSTSRFKRIQEITKLEPQLILATSGVVKQMLERMSGRLTGGSISLANNDMQDADSGRAPVINITEEVGNAILANLKTDLVTVKNQINTSSSPQTTAIAAKINTTLGVKEEQLSDPNVIGLLEGTDKKDEVLVITAHYDHDGVSEDGTIFFGADDNASGTVGVLELARAFAQAKEEGKGPRRSILFIAFAAEEKGLLGSAHYVDNPVVPLSNTVVNLNMDMIGRIDDKHLDGNHNYIHAIGAKRTSNELFEINEEANRQFTQLEIDYMYDVEDEPMQLFRRSDQYSFAKHGIPVIFYFSGLHPHYHTPEDTIDKIDFPMMVKREHLVFHTAWEIANRENRLAIDVEN